MTTVDKTHRTSNSSRLLGYGSALALLLLGIGAWVERPELSSWLIAIGQLWAAAILLFLAGIHRGRSLAVPEGSSWMSVVAAMILFGVGLAGLMLPLEASLAVLMAGFLGIGAIDVQAARRETAHAALSRLEPLQTVLFVVALAILWAWAARYG